MAHVEQTLAKLGRVLSIEAGSRRVAWAYFRDSRLLDYRIRNFRDGALAQRGHRSILPYLINLLDRFAPHALLIPKVTAAGTRARSPHVAKVLRQLVREALSRGIAVHVISSEAVKASLTQSDGALLKNITHVSAAVLERYPELTLLMPRPRRIWDPERYSTPLFRAVAMYLAWEYQPSPADKRIRNAPDTD